MQTLLDEKDKALTKLNAEKEGKRKIGKVIQETEYLSF